MPTKLISVILPVYNAEPYLSAALNSLLSQSISDFEVLIINDGSTDASGRISESYAKKDHRIQVIHQHNQGVVCALNHGIDQAKGKFIARMDADDTCFANRFERQLHFLNANQAIGVCGTWMKAFSPTGKGGIWKQPADDASIRCKLLFRTALCHPTIMARRDVFDENHVRYDVSHIHAEDYGLWSQLIPLTKFANMEEVLYNYQRHPNQATQLQDHSHLEIASGRIIHGKLLRNMGYEPTETQLDQHAMIAYRKFPLRVESLLSMEEWLQVLERNNHNRQLYPEPQFGNNLSEMWWQACRSATRIGRSTWRVFKDSTLSSRVKLSPRKRFRVMLKCIFRLK